jgi:pimeloyl-ACP methyl ester carboxylesterase
MSDSDQVVDPDYGREFAGAIPGAEFQLLPNTGHLPQTPGALLDAVWPFAQRHALIRPTS